MSLRIILASSSPRRRQLLQQIGLTFDVMPADIDETVDSDAVPSDVVESLALKKAELIAQKQPGTLVIGSDSVVVCRSKILGKPSGPDEAQMMLRLLSGITHQVFTGVALIHNDSTRKTITRHTFHEQTDVTFGNLQDEEIAGYVRTGNPLDKAGAYGIQDDLGALFVKKISGDYYNVVGFPLFRFYREVNKHVPGTVTPFTSTAT